MLHRHCPDDDGSHTEIKHPLDILTGAESAANLHRNPGAPHNLLNAGEVCALPPECAIEINQMQSLCSSGNKTFCDCCRIVVVHGFVLLTALQQSHAAALAQINGGENQHSSSRVPKGQSQNHP